MSNEKFVIYTMEVKIDLDLKSDTIEKVFFILYFWGTFLQNRKTKISSGRERWTDHSLWSKANLKSQRAGETWRNDHQSQ